MTSVMVVVEETQDGNDDSRELAEVVAGHLGLDFDGGEGLTVLYRQLRVR